MIKTSEEDKKFFESLLKLFKEYDVRISPRGGLSKTRKLVKKVQIWEATEKEWDEIAGGHK